MFVKILFNYRGERTHFQGEWTQGKCVIRATDPIPSKILSKVFWKLKNLTSLNSNAHTDRKFLRNPNLNNINFKQIFPFFVYKEQLILNCGIGTIIGTPVAEQSLLFSKLCKNCMVSSSYYFQFNYNDKCHHKVSLPV